MYNRYKNNQVIYNDTEAYSELLNNKKLTYIQQYSVFRFNNLKYFNEAKLNYKLHYLSINEKLESISNQYYGSPDYGWMILFTNNIASEMHIKQGMYLKIYYPLTELIILFQEKENR